MDSAKEKIKNILDFSSDVENGNATWQKYFETLKGGKEYLIDVIKNTDDLSKLTGEDLIDANKAARDSAIAHNNALKQQTISAKAAAIGMKALSIAGNMLLMWGISEAISLVVSGLDKLINAEKYAREKLEQLKQEYNDITSEISSCNEELKTTVQRMRELENMDSLTFAEKEEYDNLVKSNNELKRTIDLLEQKEKITNKKKNKAFVSAMQKDVVDNPFELEDDFKEPNNDPKIGVLSDGKKLVSEEKYIENRFKERENLVKDLYKASTEEEKEEIQSQIDEIDDYFITKQEEWETDSNEIDYIKNPTTEDDKKVNQWLDYINDFQDKVAIATGGENAKQNAFNRIVDNLQFDDVVQGLQDLGKEGKVTAEMLDDPKYDDFISKLVELGVIDSADNLNDIVLAFNSVNDEISNYDNKNLSSFSSTFDKIWNSLDDDNKTKEAKKKLLELAKAGKLTIKEFEKSSIADSFLESTKLSAEEATQKINELISSAEQLSSMKTGISSISSILGQKKENLSNKKTKTQGIGADVLAGMPEEVKAQTKAYEHFVEVLGTGTSRMEDCKKAANRLATAYVTSSNFLANLTDDNEDYYISILKEMNIENAESIVSKTVTANKEKLQYQTQALEEATKDLTDKTDTQSKAFVDEAKMSKLAKVELFEYLVQEEKFSTKNLSVSDRVKELNKLAKAYFNISDAIQISTAMGADSRYWTSPEAYEDEINKQIDKIVKRQRKLALGDIEITPSDTNKKKDKKSKKDKKKSTQQIDWISRALDRLSSKLDLVKAKYDNLFSKKKAKNSDSLLALQNKNLERQYKLLQKTEKYQEKAQKKYTKKANSVKLDSSLKKAVREGRIKGSMKQLIATYGEKKAEKIQKYQDWYDKAQEQKKNKESTKTAQKENRIQKYQNIVDNAEEKRSLAQARKENANTAAKKNDQIEDEKEYLKTSYEYQIKIAKKEKDSLKVAQLKAEKKKELRDLEIEIHQNLADEYQANLDLLSAQKANLKTADEKNGIVESEKQNTKQLYKEKIEIAKLEGDTTEELRLQQELNRTLVEYEKEKADNISHYYENLRRGINNSYQDLENSLNELELKGYIVGSSLYEAEIALNKQKKANYETERTLLQQQLANIEKETDEWYDTVDAIQACDDSISDCIQSTEKLYAQIRKIAFLINDEIKSALDLPSSEFDLFIKMMSSRKLVSEDTGNFTNEGVATLGSYYSQWALLGSYISDFANDVKDFEEKVNNKEPGYDTPEAEKELLEKRKELVELQNSQLDLENSQLDLWKQRYQAELDYLQDIINKRKELLSCEKD